MSPPEESNTTETIAVRSESTALDINPGHVAAGLTRIKQFQAVVRQQLVPNHDYGTIPGTPKPSLWKPGAEKLCKLLGLGDSYEVADKVEDWQSGLFYYRITCELRSIRSGNLVAQGLGSCNSKEARYRYRWVFGSEVPDHLDKKSLAIKAITTRRGNKATMYRVENDDPFSLANTLLKMAKKRAMVDAVLSAGRLSDIFSQGDGTPAQNSEEDGLTLKQRREQMLSYFGEQGVTQQQIFHLVGVTKLEQLTFEHLQSLKNVAANIRDGIASAEDFFGSASGQGTETPRKEPTTVDDVQPEAATEKPQLVAESEQTNTQSAPDGGKAKLIDRICTRLSEMYPDNTAEAQGERLKMLNYVFGKTEIEAIAKLPSQILEVGLQAIKPEAVLGESSDVPV